MVRKILYDKVDRFLEDLATKHIDIQEYIVDSTEAIQNKISSVDGIKSPFLSLTNYEGKLNGNQQRTFNERAISFVVCLTNIAVDDYDAQRQAKSKAEEIGLDILSRINIDAKIGSIDWLANNFIKESVVYEEVELEFIEGCFGMQFTFTLNTIEPLTVDPTKWYDGSNYCTPNK